MANPKDCILLVDDEDHLLTSLGDYLSLQGFQIVTASSGEEALLKLQTVTPDLIILDISMPGMGGLGFLKQIAGEKGKTRYPVLVLTARANMKDFFDTVDVDGFLAKPCDETELADKVRRIISIRQALSDRHVDRGRASILLGEDEATKAHELTRAFEEAGYDVERVDNGPKVLELAISKRPDAIVIKQILPNLNGHAVAALVDGMPTINSIPVLLYTDAYDTSLAPSRYSHIKCIRRVLHSDEVPMVVQALKEVLLG
jgi:DNA-binding response OmpR family regulator